MTHFLADWRERADGQPPTVEWWNALVDGFDVETLANQLASVGAGYHLLSIGQNSGYYLAPNAEYDQVEDITSEMPRKMRAIRAHQSQLQDLAYDRAARGLNEYRGALSGRCRFAEVFQVLRFT